MRAWIGMMALACAFGAQAAPKVAVTDLAYQERAWSNTSTSFRPRTIISQELLRRQRLFELQRESTPPTATSNRPNLRKFTGDIKGEILRPACSSWFRARLTPPASKGDVYDVIKRIKAGNFKGADYVLFGTVSDIDFTQRHERAGQHRQLFGGAGTDPGGGLQPDQHQDLRDHLGLHGDGRRLRTPNW